MPARVLKLIQPQSSDRVSQCQVAADISSVHTTANKLKTSIKQVSRIICHFYLIWYLFSIFWDRYIMDQKRLSILEIDSENFLNIVLPV